jgi:branched-chain amino acid aminotransferase
MTAYAYFEGRFVPLAEAKISIRTHALHYGTGCFEGIRGYWNPDDEEIYLFRMLDHYLRLERSGKILGIKLPHTPQELCEITVELIRRNGHREDVYVRPIAYKASEAIGVRMHDLEDGFAIFTAPFGKYLPMEKGVRCCVSSYRRVDDNAIPARAKVTGIYVNSALAKTEAQLNGFDEAIMLTHEGHVSEGSGENIFLVIDGVLVTPAASENILPGITRATVITLAREELGIPTVERQVDRSELYIADECFLTGTAAEISPVIEIDRRPVGGGTIGPITARLQELFFQVVRGRHPRYRHWCTPVYKVPAPTSR